jgi:predicted nicotinamide N-methyase
MFIEIGFDPGFQVLECGFHAGVSVLAFVDGAAEVVGADKSGNYFMAANFNAANFLHKTVNAWVLGFTPVKVSFCTILLNPSCAMD